MALYGYIEGRSDGLGVPDNVVLRCDCADRCELEVERQLGDEITLDNADGTSKKSRLPDEYYITFKSKSRYNTLNMFEALKIKLKKIWYIIRGKDYLYYDIEVDEKAMKQFVESLQDLISK